MKLTKFMVQGNLKDDEGRLCLGLRKMELGSVSRLNLFMDTSKLAVLDLDGNFIKEIDQEVLKSLTSLEIMSISTNFIEKTGIFCHLSNLQQLDLSTNRLRVVSNLSTLKQLNYLVILTLNQDLSHNKIEFIEKLPENLKILKAAHNMLDEIGWLTPQLQLLDVRNNNISKLTPLGRGFPKLQILDLENNNLPMEEFSEFLLILERYTKGLQELVLEGNPISNNPDYVLDILSRRPLQKLDHLIVTPYMIKAFTEKKQQLDIQQVIRETKAEYMKRIKQEVEVKEKILSGLKQKQMQVEHLFQEYRRNNSKQLTDFLDYCDRGLIKDGKQLEHQRELIKKFEKKLKEVEEKNYEEARERQRRYHQEKIMLEKGTRLAAPKKQLYGQPNYMPLPTIEEVSSVRKDTSEREPAVQPLYESKRPPVEALPLAEVFPRRSLNPPGRPPLPPNSSSKDKLPPSSISRQPTSNEQRASGTSQSQRQKNQSSSQRPQNSTQSQRQNETQERQQTDTSQETISANKGKSSSQKNNIPKNSSSQRNSTQKANRPSTTSIQRTIQQNRKKKKLSNQSNNPPSKQSSNPSDPKQPSSNKNQSSNRQSNDKSGSKSKESKQSGSKQSGSKQSKQSGSKQSGSKDSKTSGPATEQYTIFHPQCFDYLRKYYNQPI